MKHVFLILLFAIAPLAVAQTRDGSTTLRLSPTQINEYDATYWVTLTRDQQKLILQRAGVAPSRLLIQFKETDGNRAGFGFNIAIKRSATEIIVLHRFLLSDADAKKKREENRRMAGRPPWTSKEFPSIAVDADGKLWQWISRQEFEASVARNPKKIGTLYVHLPSSTSPRNTVASADTLRQLLKFAKRESVATYVISRR